MKQALSEIAIDAFEALLVNKTELSIIKIEDGMDIDY